MVRRIRLALAVVLLTLVCSAPLAYSRVQGFSWLPNQEADLAGYKLYYGSSPGNYSTTIDVGLPVTDQTTGRVTYTLQDAPDTDTVYAVTAYDDAGNESDYSNELSFDSPPSTPKDLQVDVSVSVSVTVN